MGGKVTSLLSTPLSLADTQLARLRNLSLCYELMLTPQVMRLHDERVRQRNRRRFQKPVAQSSAMAA